ncbi:MAG: nicotinate-nucleotide--dimethylbenzimidazole phosphoribosyltransferase [Pseudomonadota bacterium]
MSLAARVQAALDAKTKPPGSLGRIEAVALALAEAQGSDQPIASPARLFLCAGDHGIVAEGVSAWPQEVTAEMVRNILAGGAASSVFARQMGCAMTVVDAGVAAPLEDPRLVRAGIRPGTRNAAREDALKSEEVRAALDLGRHLAVEATEPLLLIGEMGIGNTATATLLTHALIGVDIAALTGPGAGLDAAGLARKVEVLTHAAARRPIAGPEDALAAFGGLEIAVMTGIILGAHRAGKAVLVDGFIASAAALVAIRAEPGARRACVFAHTSAEPGHRAILKALEAEPLLDLGMRLGEGTGALLALPLVQAAAAMLAEMATFESAGVSGKTP